MIAIYLCFKSRQSTGNLNHAPGSSCKYFPPSMASLSQPWSIIAHWPLPNYTAWWCTLGLLVGGCNINASVTVTVYCYYGMNNLPCAIMQSCPKLESNLWPHDWLQVWCHHVITSCIWACVFLCSGLLKNFSEGYFFVLWISDHTVCCLNEIN